MLIIKSQINKFFVIFLCVHALVWTLVPTLTNSNLPLDTIETLAWASDFQWGYIKHPPLSAWFPGLVFKIFSNKDWLYYLLSQIFVVFSFIIVWKFSEDFFQNPLYRLISILLLEGIYFYNFTTPEFNVNICQLPFWALTVFYSWQGVKQNKYSHWIFFGIFSALGILTKYIFVYLLISLVIFFIYIFLKSKKFNFKYLIVIASFFIIFFPHLLWLINNNFISFKYALDRTNLENSILFLHIFNPIQFLIKQFGILIPFFMMLLSIIPVFGTKINLKDKKFVFLLTINILPIILLILTSFITGAKIRTMWMTPFYLFIGVIFVYIFQDKIKLERLKYFFVTFLIFFILSPSIYYFSTVTNKNKRTNYPGKEIARFVQTKWDNTFSNKIEIVFGNEWDAGNLSYNLKSRPKWAYNIPQNTNIGIIVIGDYNKIKYVNEICNSSVMPSQIVLIEFSPLHNICMIGKK